MIKENFPLRALNTFGVDATAKWYAEIDHESDLRDLFADPQWHKAKVLILGGGSNVLFTQDFDGMVVRMNIKGIAHVHGDNDDILVTSGGGEVWNDLVNYCVDHGFAGIENLSLIPGSVGASPVQNIGAYGAELENIFHSCRAFEIATGTMRVFEKRDCMFSYRDSVFKSALKDKYIITEVTFRLSQSFSPNIEYGAIRQELEARGIASPSLKDISEVVSHIRVSKLPDPSTIGNAGSFFKNPVIMVDKFRQLQSAFPDIVHYPASNVMIKIAAGWMIEKCGWKGKQTGRAGTWKNQALVLVNHGGASGKEVFDLSSQIIESVKDRFGITLEREVNIL